MKRIGWRVCQGVLLCLLASTHAWAQATAQISGTVRDNSGAVLPGVDVTATQTDTGIVRSTTTNETGSYVLPNLALGPYRLEVSLQGFRSVVQTGIVLQLNSAPAVDVILELGEILETVQVEANAALVETRNVGIGRVIETERILELPLNGRNAADLIELSGGAVRVGTTSNRTFPGSPILSIAGSVLSGTTYLLDGAVNVDPYNGQSLPIPFPDALQEFKVETSGLTAQHGKGNSVGAVTKAGTNQFHGSLFEFLRNDLFNGRPHFATSNSTLTRNQFGGSLGGPILANRLFFFGGYQGTMLRQDPADTRAFVPTPAMMAGDWTAFASPQCNAGRQITLRAPFVNNRIDPALYDKSAVNIAGRLPTSDNPCGEVSYGLKTVNDQAQIIGKIDYQWTDNHSIFGRYLATTFDQPFPYSFESNLLTTPVAGYDNLAQSYAAGSTYVFSPNVVNALRVTATRAAVDRTGGRFFGPADIGVNAYSYIDQYMNLVVSSGFAIGGGQTGPAEYTTTTYTLSDDVTWVRGSHQLSFGGSFAQTRSDATSFSTAIGRYNFTGQALGLGMADFMLGRLTSLLQGAPGANIAEQPFIGVFAQDTWRATSKLTVNLGVRWDPYIPWTSVNGTVFDFDYDRFQRGVKSTVFQNAPAGLYYPGDPGFHGKQIANNRWLQLGPRAGLAWDPQGDGRMSVRASYGLSYERIPLQWFSDTLTASPFFNRVNLPSPPGGFSDPFRDVAGGNPFPLRIDASTAFVPFGIYLDRDADEHTPYTQSWNLSLQRQLGTGWLASASYIGNRSIHVWEVKTLNPAVYMPGGPCTLNGVTYNPCSTTGNTNQRRKFTLERPQDGQYLGQVELMESGGTQEYHGLLTSIERRAGRYLTVNANHTWSTCTGGDGGGQDQGLNDGSGYTGTREEEQGNCESSRRHVFNLMTVAETPEFASPTLRALASGWRLAGIYRRSTGGWLTVTTGVDRELNGVASQRPNLVGDPYGDRSGGPLSRYLNPAAFELPALGQRGTMGRANIEGPSTWNLDLALSRVFSVGDSERLELRAEAYNVTNSFQPGNPSTALNDANFGVIRTALDPRVMQFAVKFLF